MTSKMTPDEELVFRRARGRRNVALALALVGFVVLVFAVTIAKMSGG